MAIPAGDNYDKKRENNKKRESLVEKCGGKDGITLLGKRDEILYTKIWDGRTP